MTEAVAEATAPETPEAPEADKRAQALAELPEFTRNVVGQLEEWANEHNNNVVTLKAAEGDSQLLKEKLRETSSNPEVVELRAKKAKILSLLSDTEDEIDELIAPEIEEFRQNAEKASAGLEEKNTQLKKDFNAAKGYLSTLIGHDKEKLALVVPKLEGSRGSTGKSGSTGVRRIRHRTWSVVQSDGTKQYEHASAAAKAVGLDTGVFQDAFFKAAGGDDVAKWPAEVTFEVTVGENTYPVTSTANAEDSTTPAEADNEDTDSTDEDGESPADF